MKIHNLNEFQGGWFVGRFVPTLNAIDGAEVAIKRYPRGFIDEKHLHKVADEITVVVSGCVMINERLYYPDDVIVIEKGESAEFMAVSDAVTCVVKVPCVKGDKYLV